ncbi:uncharacterized protein [Lepeophtheirus salmonis]|uniref:uncharacterized protein n=1 Tax=Lepeophtheirus salmonis TaxID=72036 RepID=UPI001AE90F2B|nr:uncharacterized protein LOC121122645 [Lepeophtheirus salmonis]
MPHNIKENLQAILLPMSHRELHGPNNLESINLSRTAPQYQNFILKQKSISSIGQSQIQQFLTPDEVNIISQKLLLPQTRISALQSLQTEEALHNVVEYWHSLKNGLFLSLIQPKTSSLSIKIHLRLMKFDHLSAKEAYINMTGAVMEIYESSSIQEQGVVILKALVEFNKEFPLSWNRYPLSYIEEMITSFMKLISILPKNKKIVPLQILCMVDPGSIWLREWFLSDFGRSLVLKLLPLNLLIYLATESTGLLKTYSSSDWEKISCTNKRTLDEPLLSYSVFLTGYNFIIQCLKYKKSRQKLMDELGKEFPLNVFKEIVCFIIKNPGIGPLDYITKSIIDVIAFNQKWMFEEYFLNSKILSKIIHSLKENPPNYSSRYPCLLLKQLSTIQSSEISFLIADEEIDNILRFCSTVFELSLKDVCDQDLMLDIIQLSSGYLSYYNNSVLKESSTLIELMCSKALTCNPVNIVSNKLNSVLVELFIKNPLHAKTISRHSELIDKFVKDFSCLRNHPRLWNVKIDLCISKKLLNLHDFNLVDYCVPWDENKESIPESNLEWILNVISSCKAPYGILNDLEELLESQIRLFTSLSYISLDVYVYLESVYGLRQRYMDLYSEIGQIIDEESLRIKYFCLYTASIGSLEEKNLAKLDINPESILNSTFGTKVIRDEENEDEEETDFLRYLEIQEEDNWLENARQRYENIPIDTNLSQRTLIKLFERLSAHELKRSGDNIKDTPKGKSTQLNHKEVLIIVSLFKNYKEIVNKKHDWEKDLIELHSQFGTPNSFNWLSASLYFSSSLDTTKRIMSLNSFQISRERLQYFSEMIIYHEDPFFFSYLTEKFILPSILFEKWISQSFFNILPWKEIRRYLALITLYGVQYMIFVCIAIFRHHRINFIKVIEDKKGQSEDITFVENISLFSVSEDFKIGAYLPYMKTLDRKYNNVSFSPHVSDN